MKILTESLGIIGCNYVGATLREARIALGIDPQFQVDDYSNVP